MDFFLIFLIKKILNFILLKLNWLKAIFMVMYSHRLQSFLPFIKTIKVSQNW